MKFSHHTDYSVVTAMLPRSSTGEVLDAVLNSQAAHVFSLSARGSLMKDRWYEFLLPSLSPEQEILLFLVPNSEVEPLMEQIVMVGKLQLYGAGSIFATPCTSFVSSEGFTSWEPGNYTFESVSFDIRFNKNLVALQHITDKGQAEPITKAAIKTGAPGPTISYIRGYGLRDRLGLLRITKKHDKELVTVVLDRYDKDAVAQSMADEGHVDQPGKGIIYEIPVSRGLTNMASVFSPQRHSASIQQIIHAIDQLQGDTKWRAKQLLIHDPKAAEFRYNNRGNVKGLHVLNVLCHRKDADVILFGALESGVPGASLSNWRFTCPYTEQTSGGQRLCREFGCITMILEPAMAERTQEELCKLITEKELKDTCFYTFPTPLVRTYASSPLSKNKA